MTSQLRRRILLRSLFGSATALLAGCGNPNSNPRRELSFGEVNTQETDSEWLVSFELVKKHQGPDDLTTFHDVRVHGYARDQTEVCSKTIGTISDRNGGGNGNFVEMRCSTFPTMLTYSVDESICNDEIATIIDIALYDEEDGWLSGRHSRECGEGLPPEPEE